MTGEQLLQQVTALKAERDALQVQVVELQKKALTDQQWSALEALFPALPPSPPLPPSAG